MLLVYSTIAKLINRISILEQNYVCSKSSVSGFRNQHISFLIGEEINISIITEMIRFVIKEIKEIKEILVNYRLMGNSIYDNI